MLKQQKLCQICKMEEAAGEQVQPSTGKRIAVCYSWRDCRRKIDWDKVSAGSNNAENIKTFADKETQTYLSSKDIEKLEEFKAQIQILVNNDK